MTNTDLSRAAATMVRPRIGFLGVGWIGLDRMKAVVDGGLVEATAVADFSPVRLERAASLAPEAELVSSLEDLLWLNLDGIVIATPSALHAAQSLTALDSGAAVFCQKPLGRNATEVSAVLQTARAADRLLAVDLCYRRTAAMQAVKDVIVRGEIGDIYAVELTFHNAYGPDKPWFYDAALAGGGCMADLGIHLVDLALWTLDFPAVTSVSSELFAAGTRLCGSEDVVEDYATATLRVATDATVRLACSWNLAIGRDAEISAVFHGTEGGVALRNIRGSFYDFIAERYRGTEREILVRPPDSWGGRAISDWARLVAEGQGFDEEANRLLDVASTLDRIYGR